MHVISGNIWWYCEKVSNNQGLTVRARQSLRTWKKWKKFFGSCSDSCTMIIHVYYAVSVLHTFKWESEDKRITLMKLSMLHNVVEEEGWRKRDCRWQVEMFNEPIMECEGVSSLNKELAEDTSRENGVSIPKKGEYLSTEIRSKHLFVWSESAVVLFGHHRYH